MIGVAPAAKWIAVPGICNATMPGNLGDDIGGLKAYQWLLCPTDLSGDLSTANCSKAPHVINNSWGSANPLNDVFRPAIQALRAAGIAPVFASGNPQAGFGSIGAPANAPEAIAVGATDARDQVAAFSGRGPSYYVGEQKPELSAPGDEVRSSVRRNEYDSYSGTSMAAPHVSGLIALMISADLKDGTRDFSVDELEQFMQLTAVDLGPSGPDNEYGHGRINTYEAVSWTLASGDLSGSVNDVETGLPIASASISGRKASDEIDFLVKTGDSGVYSLTVPVGTFDVLVEAWGYYSQTFRSQTVFPRILSVKDFSLKAQPRTILNGVIQTSERKNRALLADSTLENLPIPGAPVSGARIYVVDAQAVSTGSTSDGTYSLALPPGTHQLVLEAERHRTLTFTVTIPTASSEASNSTRTVTTESAFSAKTLNLSLEPAPKILLVNADAHLGWFFGWPVHRIVEDALEQQGYQYDLWHIEYTGFNDTQTLADGQIGRGVPSLETLNGYDVVIWLHSGCSSSFCVISGRGPSAIGAEDELIAYLDGGGRLFLSGQNVSPPDFGESRLFDDYLLAKRVEETAASEGDTLVGLDFWADLELDITNASLYGFANGVLTLSPDSIDPVEESGAAISLILQDGDGSTAALAINPCDKTYRALYFAAGLENVARRGESRATALPIAMNRSLDWLIQQREEYALNITAATKEQVAQPGLRTHFPLRLINTGQTELSIQLGVQQMGNEHDQWQTRIYTGRLPPASFDLPSNVEELTEPILLPPCGLVTVTLVVDLPASAKDGEESIFQVLAQTDSADQTAGQVELVARAFSAWQVEPELPTSRTRLMVAALPGDTHLYAIGGWKNANAFENSNDLNNTSLANERYDACHNQWEQMAPLPEPLGDSGIAVLNGKIYVVGGRISTHSNNTIHDGVYRYNPASDEWQSEPPLPRALMGPAVAAAQGKLYVFGGRTEDELSDAVYVFDPKSNRWQKLDPLPGGKRVAAAAATIDGKIYVVGGAPTRKRVDVYDPVTNQWSTAPNTNMGRADAGLAAAPDGYLYLTGGGNPQDSLRTTERYRPGSSSWQLLPSLNDRNHRGGRAAYAAGLVFIVGGDSSLQSTESLQVRTSFCQSKKSVEQNATASTDKIRYAVNLYADPEQAMMAQVIDPIPDRTRFLGFASNSAGAIFNAETNQVEWQGDIPAGSEPISFTYELKLVGSGWMNGEIVASRASFTGRFADDQQVIRFDRPVTNKIFLSDFSDSTIDVDQEAAIRGERLNYTVKLESRTIAGGGVTVTNPLPEGLVYVPDSLSYANGTGRFDPDKRVVHWQGTIGTPNDAYLNVQGKYIWRDSNRESSDPSARFPVAFDWIEIKESGTRVLDSVDDYDCGFPIGFSFPFYGEEQRSFCTSTNGFISFDADGDADYTNACPLPDRFGNSGLIAAVWDLLYLADGVYYQTLGKAPNRALVVEWVNAEHITPFDPVRSTFQIVLHENGMILMQFLDVEDESGSLSTTGISSPAHDEGITYACGQEESLQDELAVLFVPPGISIGQARTDLSYTVQIANSVPANAPLTNTVTISDGFVAYTRGITTKINPVSLDESTFKVGQDEYNIGDRVEYQVLVHNTGLFTATDTTVSHRLPDSLVYIPDSVTCQIGSCTYAEGEIRWTGEVAPSAPVILRYAAHLRTLLSDLSLVRNIAQIDDGFGGRHELRAHFMARSSNLSDTLVQIHWPFVEPGMQITFESYVRNIGAVATTASLEILLPSQFKFLEDSLACGTGTCRQQNGVFNWSGQIEPRSAIPIRFTLQTPRDAEIGQTYPVQIEIIDDGRQERILRDAFIMVSHLTYSPVTVGPSRPSSIYLPLFTR